jgi:hypothetical protein
MISLIASGSRKIYENSQIEQGENIYRNSSALIDEIGNKSIK